MSRELDARIAREVFGWDDWSEDDLPAYSTDNAEALLVAEHFRLQDYTVIIEGDNNDPAEFWFADFYLGDSNAPWKPGTRHGQARAATLSMAICEAALAIDWAAGAEVPA